MYKRQLRFVFAANVFFRGGNGVVARKASRADAEPCLLYTSIDVDGSELSKTVNSACGLRGDVKLTLQKLIPLVNAEQKLSLIHIWRFPAATRMRWQRA